MKKISIFDTTISNYNIGNEIIMHDVNNVLRNIFPKDFFYKIPSMEITNHTLEYIKNSDLVFLGGTNALSSKMEKYKQWDLSIRNTSKITKVILFGVGWWQYQDTNTSFYTKYLLKKSLNKDYYHSVRDSYTENKLKEIGFTNILNTGCPTLWKLTKEHCNNIKNIKSDNVIFTFTDYKPNIKRDSEILEILKKNYKKLYYFIQGSGDYDYLKNNFLITEQIETIDPDLEKYNKILEDTNIEYVGTRLHAGIRALQYLKRTIIIGIDNRAIEMQKDFNIPVINQNNLESLDDLIKSSFKTEINLPEKNIKKWVEQFK
jgi:polysaccharide pyruvyl transferase WcaK-like protein